MQVTSNRFYWQYLCPATVISIHFCLMFYSLVFAAAAYAETGSCDRIAATVEQKMKAGMIAGAAIVLADRDGLICASYLGVESWQTMRPVDATTWFRVGSISKAFTGLALLRAEADGLLRLDQAITDLLGGASNDWLFENSWSKLHPLTVAGLLEHTAGWYDMSRLEFDHNQFPPIGLARALRLNPTSRTSHWPPGQHAVYSNSGPGLAAYVLEQVSGVSFDSYVQRRVFRPLGMTASLLPEEKILARLATGYDQDGKTVIPYWNIIYRAAGGMNVLPHEMASYLQLMLRRGRRGDNALFSEAQLERAEEPRTTLAAKAGLRFGYGLGNYSRVHRRHVIHGHGGDADGYLARMAYSHDAGLGYFFVINAFNHPLADAFRERLDDWLVAELPPHDTPPLAVLAKDKLEQLTGTYRLAATRFPQPGWQQRTLEIRLRDGRLSARRSGGRWLALLPVSESLFRRAIDPVATRAFIPLPGGAMVYQDPSDNWLRQ